MEIMGVFPKSPEIYSLFVSKMFHVVFYFPLELNQTSLKQVENLPLAPDVFTKF